MDLERIQIVPRVRGDAQAIDLGFRLARVFYWHLFWPALVVMSSLACLIHVVFPSTAYIYAFIVLCWLKPLVEQEILLSGSRLIFSEHPKLRTLYGLIWRQHLGDLFVHLTWRRLSPTRSFDLPLAYLENLRGHARQQRMALLHVRGSGLALLLTFTTFVIERGLEMGFYIFIFMLFSDHLDVVEFSIWSITDAGALVGLIIPAIVMAMVAPFYVLGGFSLYLNRRIALEGWDIDLIFRLLQQRLEKDQKRKPKKNQKLAAVLSGVCLYMIFGLPASLPSVTLASEASISTAPLLGSERAVSREMIEEILNEPDFHRIQNRAGWELKEKKKNEEEPPQLHSDQWIAFLEWLEKHGLVGESSSELPDFTLMAQVLRVVFIVLVLLPILYLLVQYRGLLLRWLSLLPNLFGGRRFGALGQEAPSVLNQPVQKEALIALPAVPSRVLALREQGQIREALGLWYRQTLLALSRVKSVSVEFYHTESECVRLFKNKFSESDLHCDHPVVVLEQLVRLWQQCAYGRRAPDPQAFDAVMAQWQRAWLEKGAA